MNRLTANLKNYVAANKGPWFAAAGERTNEIVLRDPDDDVTLAGPLNVRVSVVAENTTAPISGGQAVSQMQEVYGYDLNIPAGHTWKYDLASAGVLGRLGVNAGLRVIVRPTLPRPTFPVSPVRELPCDFAVRDILDTGRFFPSGCEPCGGGPVRTPPTCGPSLTVPPAPGGCVRPRFFDGMWITSGDLETQLRYVRMKNRLHNRAAGQGVIWGFPVRREGSRIVVGAGYGADCCGNDLAVTCDYRVDIAALLSDPAICNLLTAPPGQRGRCLHLLLEYVECQEDARPVHGDACSTRGTFCEMSRVRETVRLRLVPPRDLAPASPLPGLIEEILKLTRPRLIPTPLPLPVPLPSAPAAANWEPAPPGTQIPWALDVTDGSGTVGPFNVRPLQNQAVSTPVITLLKRPLRFRISPDGGRAFVSGTVTGNGQGLPANLPPNGAGWSFDGDAQEVQEFRFPVEWESQGNPELRGNAVVRGTIQGGSDKGGVVIPFQDLPAERVRVRIDQGQGPAAVGMEVKFNIPGGPASGKGTVESIEANGSAIVRLTPESVQTVRPEHRAILFAPITATVTIDPGILEIRVVAPPPPPVPELPCCDEPCCGEAPKYTREQALQILLAALVYGRLVQERAALAEARAAAGRVGTPATLPGVSLLPHVAKLFPSGLPTRQQALELLLARLYAAWCAAGLYLGPVCDDEPYGVVIGCAEFEAGDLCCIDPLGGRRWVLHGPLLNHWAAQFGLQPLDVGVSRLFSRLCCISHLPGFGDLFRPVPVAPVLAHIPPSTAQAIGPAEADVSDLLEALKDLDRLDPGSLAGRVGRFFCAPRRPAFERPVRLQPSGFLLRPRLERLVSELRVERAPAPLMRDATADLAHAVLAMVPVSAVAGEGTPVTTGLDAGAVPTAADLLDRDPVELLRGPLEGRNARELDEAVREAQKKAEAAVEAVAEAAAAHDDVLTEPGDLAKPEVADAFVKELRDRLEEGGVKLSEEEVRRAVASVTR